MSRWKFIRDLFTFKLDNNIDLECLKKAIEDTIDAHPGLKAIIKFDKTKYKVFRDDAKKNRYSNYKAYKRGREKKN